MMGSVRNTFFFAVLVGASLVWAYFLYAPSSQQSGDNTAAYTEKERLYPDLSSKIELVTEVQLATRERDYRFVKSAAAWVEHSFSYPTHKKVVDKLLQSVASLQKLEAKTANPSFYSKIGVDEKDVKDAGSFRVGLVSKDEKIVDLLIGIARQSKSNNPSEQWFVRKATDADSWLVEGDLGMGPELGNWLDTRAFPLDATKLAKLVVHQGKQGDLILERQEGNQWKVMSMPVAYKNQKIEQPELIEANLMRIEFTGLKAIQDLKLPENPDWLVELYLESGEGLRMQVYDQPESLYGLMTYITTASSANSETAKALAPYMQAWKNAALAFSKDELNDLMQPSHQNP